MKELGVHLPDSRGGQLEQVRGADKEIVLSSSYMCHDCC